MKRILSLLLALALLSSMPALAEVEYGSFAVEIEPGSWRAIEAPLAGSLNAVCVDGSDVYVLEDGQLYSADDELNRKELLHTFDRELCGFSVSDGAFYFSYADGDRIRFARLTAGGEVEELFDVQTGRTLFRMLVARETVFALWEYSAYEQQVVKQAENLCQLSAYDLSGRERPLPFEDAMDVAFSPTHGVLLLQSEYDGDMGVCALNPETGAWQNLNAAAGGLNLAVSPDGSALFIRDSSGIYRRSDGDHSSVDLNPDPWLDSALACTATRLISYRLHGDMVARSWSLSETAQTSSKNVLTLINAAPMMDSAIMQSALEQFRQLHPDVEIVSQEMDMTQLTTAILANDGSVDVIGSGMPIEPIIQAGALYDLNQDAELKARLERWVGSQVLCRDGIRFGIPDCILTSILRENESLSQYAPELDWQSCSWSEVLEAAEHMETDLTGDGIQDIWFLYEDSRNPLWFQQYLASFDVPNAIVFDTDTFRQLAEQYRRCMQAGVIMSMYDPDSDSDSDRNLALYQQFWISGCGMDPFLPLPTIDGRRTIVCEPYLMSIARTSRHIDWALDLLKCYTSDEAQRANWDPDFVYPNFQLSPGWEEHPYYAVATDGERENLKRQQEYVNQSVWLIIDDNFYAHSFDLFKQFYADQITLDELVDSLQQKLQMVLMG